MTGRHEGGGGELPFEPDARQLVDRLQAFISENEVAAELAVQGCRAAVLGAAADCAGKAQA